jgi:RHS repeat-associated protein
MDDSCTRYYKYSYDGVGNRLSQKTERGTTRYSYDAADELMREITPGPDVVYAYDLNGNETRKGTTRYTYNLENEPTILKKDGVKVASYTYTGDNLLATKITLSARTSYGWDSNASLPELALEKDSQNGTVLRAYSYGQGSLELQTQQGTRTYHQDSLGSVVGLTDESGDEVASYRYSPYGEASSDDGTPSAEADANPIRFTGQHLDSDSALYYLRAREYDSGTGRFLEVDPLESGAGELDGGSYVYVDDRPTVMIDPSGESGCAASTISLSNSKAPSYYKGNGCGPGGWKYKPNRVPGIYNFWEPCNNHDYCYGEFWPSVRRTCDDNFLEDMNTWCDDHAGWGRGRTCRGYAQVYYNFVRGWRAKIKITPVGPTVSLPWNHIGRDVFKKNQLNKCPYKKKGNIDVKRCTKSINSRAS